VACVWTAWCLCNRMDCLITNIEIVLQQTRTVVSAVEGRTRQQSTSALSRCALQKHLACSRPYETVRFSRCCEQILFCRRYQSAVLCGLRTQRYNIHSANFDFIKLFFHDTNTCAFYVHTYSFRRFGVTHAICRQLCAKI
jgi:hypothetical protein